METFRKIYNKLTILFCLIITFVFMVNMEEGGIGYACLYIFAGLVCFGAWSIGREQIDPKKLIRSILLLFLWSLLGFGMMAIGVACIIADKAGNNGLVTGFLIVTFFALILAYVYNIIRNKDWFAIASVVLFIIGFIIAAESGGVFIIGFFSLLIFLAAIASFVISLIRGIMED